jgi:hypothetical protein
MKFKWEFYKDTHIQIDGRFSICLFELRFLKPFPAATLIVIPLPSPPDFCSVYNHYTDDDLLFAEGKKEELMGRLQNKLGKSKAQIQQLIERI